MNFVPSGVKSTSTTDFVWPAYVQAHIDILENKDIEKGRSNGRVAGLIVIEGLEMSMSEMVNLVCERLVKVVQVAN